MVRIGTREFVVPLWLWVGLPVALALYAGLEFYANSTGVRTRSPAGEAFPVYMMLTGTGALTGFLIADVARRSRLAWWGLPILFFASTAVAMLIGYQWFMLAGRASGVLLLSLINLGASVGGGGGGVPLVLGLALGAQLLAALAAAAIVTLVGRIASGSPLLSREAHRELWAHTGGAMAWMVVVVGGIFALRLGYGRSQLGLWTEVVYASGATLAATGVHLWLVHRSRRDATPTGQFRTWLVAALCIAGFLYSPFYFGKYAVRFSRDYVRPALNATGVWATPALDIVGYRIEVPYREHETWSGPPAPDGGPTFISVRLRDAYALDTAAVQIHRRDVPLVRESPWVNERRVLDAAERQKPGEDAITRRHGTVYGLALRVTSHPELEFFMSGLKPTTSWEQAEQTLRRFVQERVRRKP